MSEAQRIVPDPSVDWDDHLIQLDKEERYYQSMDTGYPTVKQAKLAFKPAARAQAANEALFFSQEHADLEIVCNEETFKVHKCIVLPRAVNLDLVTTDTVTEAGNITKIHIDDEEPGTVKFWLYYLYTGGVNFKSFCLDEDEVEMICVGLMEFARKIDDAVLEACFEPIGFEMV